MNAHVQSHQTAHQTRKARVAIERAHKASEAPKVALWAPESEPRYYADGLTRRGRAGQCPSCGSWRTDGQLPTVHRTGCTDGPDGLQLPPGKRAVTTSVKVTARGLRSQQSRKPGKGRTS